MNTCVQVHTSGGTLSGDKERTATSRSVERKKMVRFFNRYITHTNNYYHDHNTLIRSAGINDYIDEESIDNSRQDTSMNETIIIEDNNQDELGDESIIFSPASARSVNSSSLSSSPPPTSSSNIKKKEGNKSQILTQTIDALYVVSVTNRVCTSIERDDTPSIYRTQVRKN